MKMNKENIAFNNLFENDTSLFNYSSLTLEKINFSNLSKENLIILNEITKINTGLHSTIISFVKKIIYFNI